LKAEGFASISRKTIIYFIVVASFAIFTFRLIQMQIIEHQAFDEKSASNSIKPIEQIPLRGVFYDRNMEVIASNSPAYTLRITPSEYDRKLSRLVETVIDADSGFINKVLYNNRFYSKYLPIRIKRGIDFKAVSWLEENAEHLPGIDYVVEMQRSYPAGIVGSHLFGYNKEISPLALEKEKNYYSPGDYVGNSGIEKTYEKELRGQKGYNYILVDAKRKEIGKYKNGNQDSVSHKGRDLVLSIDADVQRVAERELKGFRGAAVAIEPKTGEVLALVSAPDFDLNQFSYITSKDYLSNLYNDPGKPAFNRSTMSGKPAGSTFKMMSAIAALDMGVITTQTIITCGGGFYYGRFFKCHGGPHGPLNVIHAIEKSCNTFFYNLIYRIGLDKWSEYAHRLGFGQKTGIDIADESNGFIPNSKYYEKIYGPNWPRSIMASLGIGQGEVSATPIQLAQYTALIANFGNTFVPHIVKGYLKENTREFVPLKFKEIRTGINPNVFDIVRQGMFLVVQGAGTATGLKMDDIKIAGKTGTAQNPHGKDHAVFICFAPYDDPKIAIAVVVENVGFGATYAAPIAKKMIEAYLRKDKLKKETKPLFDKNQLLGAKLEN
jgi:penicillin-binding protein 2